MNIENSKEFLSGTLLGLFLFFTTWMAIQKAHQMRLPTTQKVFFLILILGLKIPLYLWIIIQGSYFSISFWAGWGIIYFLAFVLILLRSLVQVQRSK